MDHSSIRCRCKDVIRMVASVIQDENIKDGSDPSALSLDRLGTTSLLLELAVVGTHSPSMRGAMRAHEA